MKTLTILRHAKSSWDESGLSDFERPLNDRGTKAARRIGEELQRRGMRFDHVLASPAVRVRETLDGVADGYGADFEVAFDERIYMATVGALLEIVRGIPDDSKRPLLVGHNPGLELLLSRLTRGHDGGPRDKVLGKYPTGALAVVQLPAKLWREVAEGSGEIVELILPRELRD